MDMPSPFPGNIGRGTSTTTQSPAGSGNQSSTLTNPAPIDVLPELLQICIEDWHQAYRLPKDFYLAGILAAGSGAIGNGLKLNLNGMIFPASIYIALVAKSGIGKTPALNMCLRPLEDLEIESDEQFREELSDWQKKDSEDTKNSEPKPKRKDIVVNDSTLEALMLSLQHNAHGVLLKSDELAGWTRAMNQYRKGADVQHWLSIWNVQPTKTSRKTTDTVFAKQPFCTVIGGIQPDVLEEITSSGKQSNGFFQRILFAYPDKQTKKPLGREPVDPTNLEFYCGWIKELRKETEKGTTELKYTAEAEDLFYDINEEYCRKCNESATTEEESIYPKLEQYCNRLAIILHGLEKATSGRLSATIAEDITAETLAKAKRLTDYFENCIMRVLLKSIDEDPLEELSANWRQFYEELPKGYFQTSEAIEAGRDIGIRERTVKAWLGKHSKGNSALLTKVKHGYYCKNERPSSTD